MDHYINGLLDLDLSFPGLRSRTRWRSTHHNPTSVSKTCVQRSRHLPSVIMDVEYSHNFISSYLYIVRNKIFFFTVYTLSQVDHHSRFCSLLRPSQ